MDHLTQTLARVDAVMAARSDLGVEMSLEEVPLIQKRIIAEACRAGKPVITATQMLHSMMESPRPTRAEVTNVANAILNGTDAVMLSDETTAGRFRMEAATALDQIARTTEPVLLGALPAQKAPDEPLPLTEAAINRAACWLAQDLGAAAVVASTDRGSTTRLVARYRPAQPMW